MTNLAKLLRKYQEDELFRRLAIGSPTWSEMVAEAIMKDRTETNYRMAVHNAASIDLVAENGNHVQVKTVGTVGSFAGIRRGRDTAVEIMVITTFGSAPRYFLVPMIEFKQIARTYSYPERNHFSWEISGSRIKNGALDAFEISP
ncbi:hypothetical protein L2449_09520 [Mesorhizobium muleiense]|uniref:hypothetical protein n=1 Tax=Mesorhizobium muleiense TaxID=1004279 RepID=UPI001F41FA01|nr:hypothetical protein [Mesorhizobium muleiense]MCF6117152.1 hypothetical protein [Mesorhizobium muleiense]